MFEVLHIIRRINLVYHVPLEFKRMCTMRSKLDCSRIQSAILKVQLHIFPTIQYAV